MTGPREPHDADRRGQDPRIPAPPRHPGYDNYPPARRATARRTPLPPLHPVDRSAPTDRIPPGPNGHSQGEPSRTGQDRNGQAAPGPDETARVEQPPEHQEQSTRRFSKQDAEALEADTDDGAPKPRPMPRKLTVTRVAAMRSRELTNKSIATFRRAATADGADKSGLTALTYAVMANFATDAAIAVALANTLFFSAATGEDKTKVALYLLITIAPFAVIAPLIGPALDRLQRGRRIALASSFALRTVLALVLVFNFDSWALYPCALGMMVLSKSFSVLKSAVTPRVLPPEIDLVRVNSRLTVFGLLGGTIGAGALAGALALVTGSTGALWLAALITAFGAYLSMRIPAWVEVTEGEVPATLTFHGDDSPTELIDVSAVASVKPDKRRQPLGRVVVTGLWGNGTIRVLTGFLTLYIAFVAKASTEHAALMQAAMLGLVGAAAGIGNFAGNAAGARLELGRPAVMVLRCTIAVTVVAIIAAVTGNLLTAALAALVASAASALAKVSLDASLQQDLPEESIASGFGRSETVLQLSWVIGGAMGVLLPTELWIGFTVVSVVLTIGLVQTVLTYRGASLLPGLGGKRPEHVNQETTVGHSPRAD